MTEKDAPTSKPVIPREVAESSLDGGCLDPATNAQDDIKECAQGDLKGRAQDDMKECAQDDMMGVKQS